MEVTNATPRPFLRARIERRVADLQSELAELDQEAERQDRMGRYDVDLLRKMDAKQGDLANCLRLLLTNG